MFSVRTVVNDPFALATTRTSMVMRREFQFCELFLGVGVPLLYGVLTFRQPYPSSNRRRLRAGIKFSRLPTNSGRFDGEKASLAAFTETA